MSEWEAVTPVLVIGGAVGDLVMTLPRLPTSGEDIEAQPQARQAGRWASAAGRILPFLTVLPWADKHAPPWKTGTMPPYLSRP